MKVLLSFSLLTIFILSSCNSSLEEETVISEEIDSPIDSSYCLCDELVFDPSYNHYYRFKKREGFTGICESYYQNGQLKISKNLDDGKLEGEMLSYFESGQISEQMEFMSNFQTGYQTNFNEQGDTVYHALFKRGNLVEIFIQ